MPTAAGRSTSRCGSSPTPRTRTAAVRSRLRLLQMPLRALDDGRPQRHRAWRPRPVDVQPAGLGVVRRSGQRPVADLEPDSDAVGAPILDQVSVEPGPVGVADRIPLDRAIGQDAAYATDRQGTGRTLALVPPQRRRTEVPADLPVLLQRRVLLLPHFSLCPGRQVRRYRARRRRRSELLRRRDRQADVRRSLAVVVVDFKASWSVVRESALDMAEYRAGRQHGSQDGEQLAMRHSRAMGLLRALTRGPNARRLASNIARPSRHRTRYVPERQSCSQACSY